MTQEDPMTKEEFEKYAKEWEEWSAKQGTWPYTPTDPLLDQQAEDIEESQPVVYRLAA